MTGDEFYEQVIEEFDGAYADYPYVLECQNCDWRARRGTKQGRQGLKRHHEGQGPEHTVSTRRDPLTGDSDGVDA